MKKDTIFAVTFGMWTKRGDGSKPDNFARETVNVLEKDGKRAIEKAEKFLTKTYKPVHLKLEKLTDLARADV